MKDKIGQEITIGCFIVYGHALGRCAGLRVGKVLGLWENEDIDARINMRHRITVIGIDDDWERNAPKPLSKISTLMFPDRICVLRFSQIPKNYIELLKDYKPSVKTK